MIENIWMSPLNLQAAEAGGDQAVGQGWGRHHRAEHHQVSPKSEKTSVLQKDGCIIFQELLVIPRSYFLKDYSAELPEGKKKDCNISLKLPQNRQNDKPKMGYFSKIRF